MPVDANGPQTKESFMTRADRFFLLAAALALPLSGAACEGDYKDQPSGTSAVLKFCNTRLGVDSRPTELTLEIGNPAVRISARSGTCAPSVGHGCLAIQAGSAVPITMREDGRSLTTQLLEVHSGDEWLLIAYPDAPILDGGELVEAMPCSAFEWKNLEP
jgi:hypothetical protein